MSLFAIADLHLSLGEDKPMDIFAGWNDYVDRLTDNWNKLVSDDDTIVIAGDISWAMRLEHTYIDFKFIDNLPGRKIFLKGNHDYWWGTKNKIDTFLKDNELDSIRQASDGAIDRRLLGADLLGRSNVVQSLLIDFTHRRTAMGARARTVGNFSAAFRTKYQSHNCNSPNRFEYRIRFI